MINHYVSVLLDWIFKQLYYNFFLPFTFTLHKKMTISVVKGPENFYLYCTFIGSVVTFLVNDFRLAASNLCVYKFAAVVLLKLAEYWRNLSPWRCHADSWLFYSKCLHLSKPKSGKNMSFNTKRCRQRPCFGPYIWPESGKEFVGTAYVVTPCRGVPTGLTNGPGRQGVVECSINDNSHMDKSIICCARGNWKVKHISVFIILLVEIENISQNNCVTKRFILQCFLQHTIDRVHRDENMVY